ncbi:MAG: hypothetical protein VX346_03750, partial [Planctomycetota bacterium]|nr:hypothetical protein [Planctomycetota bacterium]
IIPVPANQRMATTRPDSSQEGQVRQHVPTHQDNTLGTHQTMRRTRFPETAAGWDASSTFINSPRTL